MKFIILKNNKIQRIEIDYKKSCLKNVFLTFLEEHVCITYYSNLISISLLVYVELV